jgi:hypothetical protein
MIIDLVWQAVQSMGGVTTGIHTFTDPYDPRVGVLLCPDVDWHIDKFQGSFFINVFLFTVHTNVKE